MRKSVLAILGTILLSSLLILVGRVSPTALPPVVDASTPLDARARMSAVRWMQENPACVHTTQWGEDYDPAAQNVHADQCADKLKGMGARYGLHDPYKTNGGWTLSNQAVFDAGNTLAALTAVVVVPNGPPPAFYSVFTNPTNGLFNLPDGNVTSLPQSAYWLGVQSAYGATDPSGIVLQPVLACTPTGNDASPEECNVFVIYCCRAATHTPFIAVNPGDTIVMSIWLDTTQPVDAGNTTLTDWNANTRTASAWWYAGVAVNPPNLNQVSYGRNYIHIHDYYGLAGGYDAYTEIADLEIATFDYDTYGNSICYSLPAQDNAPFTVTEIATMPLDGSTTLTYQPISILGSNMGNSFYPTTPVACGWDGYINGSVFTQIWNSQGPY